MAIRRQSLDAGINLGGDPDLPDPRVLTRLRIGVNRRPTTQRLHKNLTSAVSRIRSAQRSRRTRLQSHRVLSPVGSGPVSFAFAISSLPSGQGASYARHHMKHVETSGTGDLHHHLQQGPATCSRRPDEQRRTHPPAEPRLIELDLHIHGVLDRMQSVFVRDAMLVRAGCPADRHPRSVLQNIDGCAVQNHLMRW
jgi:hypothetical protein